MSWIAIFDGHDAIRAPHNAALEQAELLSVGSLVVEFAYHPPPGAGRLAIAGQRQTIIAMERHRDWSRKFSLCIGPFGDLWMDHQQGNVVTRARLTMAKPDPEDVLRVTLAWHAPQRLGFMVVENLKTGSLTKTVIDAPPPWPLEDIATLVTPGGEVTLDAAIRFLAVSDKVEPVGLSAGVVAGTRVDTFSGSKAVEKLKPGDLVQTMGHGFQPLRHVMIREVPAFGSFAPTQLRAPFFGLRRDLMVSPDYRLQISGTDAEYLFGVDSVLVEARYLAKISAFHASSCKTATVTYVSLLLDAHVCLYMQGAWGESIYLGDLAQEPGRHAVSPLAAVARSDLPVHSFFDSLELQGYEAMVLVSALCA